MRPLISTRTNYTIQKDGNTFTVLHHDKLVLHGFPSVAMALQGVWVEEGSLARVRFNETDGKVTLSSAK